MNQPLKDIIEWARWSPDNNDGDPWEQGYSRAQQRALKLLLPYQQEPSWVCLEGMTAGELQAYDYGCAQVIDAVLSVLDGKDIGGVANEPWESVRKRLKALVKHWESK